MHAIPEVMRGVVLTGHGGLEKLVLREDLPVPRPGPREVLIEVSASRITQAGWASPATSTCWPSPRGAG